MQLKYISCQKKLKVDTKNVIKRWKTCRLYLHTKLKCLIKLSFVNKCCVVKDEQKVDIPSKMSEIV